MSKPWIGFLASAFLCLAGIFEWLGGSPGLGVFLIVLSVLSFILRLYFIKKMRGKDKDH
jgi:hypothetical protein